jgi:hypothetical protein
LGSLIDGIAINHDHLRFLSDDTLGSNQCVTKTSFYQL